MAMAAASRTMLVRGAASIVAQAPVRSHSSRAVSVRDITALFSAHSLELTCQVPRTKSFNLSMYRKQSTSAVAVSAMAELDSSADAPVAGQGTKLYVGNLPFNVDSETLAEIFQDYGSVELVEVMYDRETGRSRGFAFVTMSSVEDAQNSIDKLDGSELGQRTLKVNYPLPVGQRPERTERRGPPRGDRMDRGDRGGGSGAVSNKLYVGNLSWGMDDMGLEDLFSEYGKVVDAKVIMDRETGRSRGFGFVTLSSSEQATQAVGSLDGQEVDGRKLRVNVAEAQKPGGGGGDRRRGGGGYRDDM